MSNSYSSASILSDPASTVASRQVTFETPERMGNASNFAFATGNCENVLSQAFADRCFITDSTSYVEMAEWRIPLVSLEHDEIEFIVNYRTHGTVSACNVRFTIDIDGSTFTSVLSLSSTTNGFANNDVTVTFPSGTHYYATLTMEIIVNSGAEVEMFSVMAYFKRLASPLAAGFKFQYSNATAITPYGINRLKVNQAFTSRFAHNMIDNITELRKRFRSLLSWSGVYNTNSTLFPSFTEAAMSQIYIGSGDIGTLLAYPLLPSGFENLDFDKLQLHVKVIGDIDFTFFGQSFSINQASDTTIGWHIFDLEIDNGQLSVLGDTRLPYYDATFDNNSENSASLVDLDTPRANRYPPALTGVGKTRNTIIGLTLIGV